MFLPRKLIVVICGFVLGFVVGAAQDDESSVFDQPSQLQKYQRLQKQIAGALQDKDFDKAFKHTTEAIALSPMDPLDHYNHACVLARKGLKSEALQFLRKSVELGMIAVGHIEKDSDLDSLRDTAEYRNIIKLGSSLDSFKIDRFKDLLKPYLVESQKAEISETNTAWDNRQASFYSRFSFSEKSEQPIASEDSDVANLLKQWYAEGRAAGNHGDLYDNRDRYHSPLNLNKFPQMTRINYGAEARARSLDMGGQKQFTHQGVVLGNSSTALHHPVFWRSQARSLYTFGFAGQLARQYRLNHLYCYPEHRDHDIGRNGDSEAKGFGDVFPANTPYVVISQGSSYSDKPFMEAIAATLAAFQPKTKDKLIESGGLMAAVQMILRSCNPELTHPDEYFTGKAHPTVFNESQLDPVAMINKANQIEPDQLPPKVVIQAIREDGSSYHSNLRLFDTPQAVARVFNTHLNSINMIVTANQSSDPDGNQLKVHWRVLRGDAKRIKIQPMSSNGATVGLSIPFHERAPIAEESEIESNRVDIGVFVENKYHISAPAFISICFPDNQKRIYESDGRIVSIDYNHPEMRDNYVDPKLFPTKDWRDDFNYSKDKKLMGWTRTRGEGENRIVQEFNAQGLLIVEKDRHGKPTKTKSVYYQVEQADANQKPIVRQVCPEASEQSTDKQ